jgi:outer membrane lipoprotein
VVETLKALRRHNRISFVAGIVALFLPFIFSACSTTKKQTTKQESYEKIPFLEIARSPDGYRGKVVKLGGVIIATENREDETVLEILEKPLNWRGRPKPGDESGGRFMVVFEKFLDEAIYRPNRPVTVVGEVMGMKAGTVGERAYNYPLLSGRDIRLWEERGYFDKPRMHIGIGVSGGSGGTSGAVGIGTSF